MHHLFLDTNILIDFLADRKPFSEHAAALFSLADLGKVRLYVSAISFNNVYYIIRKSASHKEAINLLSQLETLVQIVEVNTESIRHALKDEFTDFEDGIQYYSAISNKKIDCIVTRNHKDFKSSHLPVLSPEMAYTMVKV